MRKLIIGCGYLGHRVAQRWQECGHDVWVTTRQPVRAQEFLQQGLTPCVLDVTDPDSLSSLPSVDTLLFAVGYDRGAGISQSDVYVEGLKNVIERLPMPADRCIYISSTGVYSQTGDEWVDEQSECQPLREGGRCCWEAERVLHESPWSGRTVVLRLAGLYGPGRVPYLAQLRAGQPLPVSEQGFLNLIHVDDAAAVVMASERASLPNLYLVSDGTPVRRRDYYHEIARHLGVTPSFTRPAPESSQASRAASSKRISNQRLLAELPIDWQYPDYRVGLRAILAGLG